MKDDATPVASTVAVMPGAGEAAQAVSSKWPASDAERNDASHRSMLMDAVLRSTRTGNAFEKAVERIMQAIKLGIVSDGNRLPPERELVMRLGVSRVTLREAIRALQDAGFVT